MGEAEGEIAVVIAGICGRMGRETAVAVIESSGMKLHFGLERDA